MNKQLLEIAKRASSDINWRGDLERRFNESSNVVRINVWEVQKMLESAYELGRQSVSKKAPEESKPEINGIKITQEDGNWQMGTIDGIKFEAKVYEENSEEYGINGGNVSKLWVDGCLNYDRGWDMRARTKKAKELLARLLDYFKVEG